MAGDPARGRVIPLAPLSEEETHDLFDALLGEPRLPRDARDVLLAGAEGNPLYAEEFVRMLVDRRILVERDGEWALEQTRPLPVPDSVLGIIASRLDAAPADDKVVMQGAAVVGRAFLARCGGVRRRARPVRCRGHRAAPRAAPSRPSQTRVGGRRRRRICVRACADPRRRVPLHCPHAARREQHRRAAEWLSSLTGDARDRADAVAHHYVTALENARAARQPSAELQSAASAALRAAAERAASRCTPMPPRRGLWAQVLDLSAAGDPSRPRVRLAHGKALRVHRRPHRGDGPRAGDGGSRRGG